MATIIINTKKYVSQQSVTEKVADNINKIILLEMELRKKKEKRKGES